MGLRVRFQGGPRAGEVLEFGDDVAKVVFGRDPERCQVVFAPDEVQVSREHCALSRQVGGYRLELPKDNLVRIDGQQVHDGHAVEPLGDLQLGPEGPTLIVEVVGGAASLPATAAQQAGPGLHTRVGELGERSRSHQAVGLVALVLGVGVCFALWKGLTQVERRQEDTRSEVARVEQEGKETKGRLAATLDQVSELRSWTSEQLAEHAKKLSLSGEQVAALASSFREAQEREGRLQRVLAQARGAVWLVIVKDGRGGEQGFGTAWVAAPGALATNAHVADVFARARGAGHRVIVRSCSQPPRDHVVQDVAIHPGGESFREVVERYLPYVQGIQGARQSWPKGLGNRWACDVALLRVAQDAELGPALPLADPKTVEALAPGQPLGLVGYPMEGYVYSDVQHPTPQVLMGHVSSVTGYFFGRSGPSPNLLVQYFLAGDTVGGSSGSPLLNDRGEVVAINNAGNFAFVYDVRQQGTRIPLGVRYAQRVDLVRDLLEGSAEARAQELRKSWFDELAQNFQSEHEKPDEKLAQARELLRSIEPSSEATEVSVQSRTVQAPQGEGRADSFPLELEVKQAGTVMFIAIAKTWAPIWLRVEREGRPIGKPHPAERSWFPAQIVQLGAGKTTVQVTVEGPAKEEVPYSLHVLTVPAATYERFTEWVSGRWALSLRGPHAVEKLSERALELDGSGSARIELPVNDSEEVEALLLAHSSDPLQFTLQVPGGERALEASTHPWIWGRVNRGLKLTVVLRGTPGQRATFAHHVGRPNDGPEARREWLRRRWEGRVHARAVAVGSGHTGKVDARGTASLAGIAQVEAGRYLAVLSSPAGPQAARLSVGTPFGSVRYPEEGFELPGPGALHALIRGQPGVEFRIDLYRAE